ncbi:MAG: hypothetical protein QOG67_1348 [Verrucomicrobiota bacterium]
MQCNLSKKTRNVFRSLSQCHDRRGKRSGAWIKIKFYQQRRLYPTGRRAEAHGRAPSGAAKTAAWMRPLCVLQVSVAPSEGLSFDQSESPRHSGSLATEYLGLIRQRRGEPHIWNPLPLWWLTMSVMIPTSAFILRMNTLMRHFAHMKKP